MIYLILALYFIIPIWYGIEYAIGHINDDFNEYRREDFNRFNEAMIRENARMKEVNNAL